MIGSSNVNHLMRTRRKESPFPSFSETVSFFALFLMELNFKQGMHYGYDAFIYIPYVQEGGNVGGTE